MAKIDNYIKKFIEPEYTLGLEDTFFKYKVTDNVGNGSPLDIKITWGFGPRLRYSEFITIQQFKIDRGIR